MKDLRAFLFDWRIASAGQLRKEAMSSLGVSDAALRVMLGRLREAQMVRSCRMGDETIFFDLSLRRRADYIDSLAPDVRAAFLKRSGIQHHLLMLDLAQALKFMNSEFSVQGNVLTDTHSSSYSEHENFFRKHAPDLTIADKSNSKGLLCYVEVERTLKAAVRYQSKWSAYEGDESVSLVLYWVYDRRFEKRLQSLMTKYFRRILGDKTFEIGTVLNSDFEALKESAVVKLFSVGSSRTAALGETIKRKIRERAVA